MRIGSAIQCAVLLWVGVGLASPAFAEREECPTFFPDFFCERQARPDGSVMPMSFPYLFEDPYITSGVNFVGIWHEFPDDSVFMGGQIGVLALQIRLAITERLAFIATKDGYAFLDSDNPLIRDDEGFFNLGLGFKYAAWTWQGENQSAIVTPSLRYEIPSGQQDVLQGTQGDGILIPAVSWAYQHGNWHVVSALGGNAPLDDEKNSSNLFYNFHVDHSFPVGGDVLRFIVPFIELSGIHWAGSGDGSRNVKTTIGGVPIGAAAPGFEGVDVINLGNSNVKGNEFITMGWGVRLPLAWGLDVGASYERPLTDREDLWEQRVTLNVTWEF